MPSAAYNVHDHVLLEKDFVETVIVAIMLVIAMSRLGLRSLYALVIRVLLAFYNNLGQACATGYIVLVLYGLGGAFREELLQTGREILTMQFREALLHPDAVTAFCLLFGFGIGWPRKKSTSLAR